MSKCKYAMREHQVSNDNGFTWTSLEVIKGDLIEYESQDCPDSGSEITKWVDLEGDYICEDNNKYKKQILYISYDGGSTWYIYFPTIYQKGEFVEVDEDFCNNKFEGHYDLERVDPLKIVKCNGDTTLTKEETEYYNTGSLIGRLVSCKIGDCVTIIGAAAFRGCSSLTNITIPDSVTSIGNTAFYLCRSLTSVTIGNSVTSIGDTAFYLCESLTSITIPDSVTSIGDRAFNYCGSLQEITIGNSVTSISNSAFSGCTSLSNVIIGNSVTSIGAKAFQACTSLTSINIPNSVTSISNSAFSGCTSLSNVIIGNSVTSIGDWVFYGCRSLTSVTINATTPPTLGSSVFTDTNNCPIYVPCDSVATYKSAWTYYANRIFKNPECPYTSGKYYAKYGVSEEYRMECDGVPTLTSGNTRASTYPISSMTSVEIGDCVTSIGDYAFYECSGLTSINIPSGVTSIGAAAFSGCRSLTSINIPSGVTSIGNRAFYRCTSLTSINIPSGVTSIGSFAFYLCESLTSIRINAVNPPTLGNIAFNNTNNCPIYVLAASLSAYQSASGWSDYASRIQAIPNS